MLRSILKLLYKLIQISISYTRFPQTRRQEVMKSKEDYLFMLDANVQLTNPDVLQDLIRKRR